MRRSALLPLTATLLLWPLGACSRAGSDAAVVQEDPGEVASDLSASGAAAPQDVNAPSRGTIQTQPGPDELLVDLVRAKVTGDTLTVELRLRNPTSTDRSLYSELRDVSYVDDATAQRYDVLKDAAGNYLASPVMSQRVVNQPVGANESAAVWFKFPAPPATSPTISLNVPNVAPFEGVRYSR
jgi:hypothetical protein